MSSSIQQAIDCSATLGEAYAFIRDHSLWKGFFKYKWVFLFSLIIACIFSYTLIHSFIDILNGEDPSEVSFDINTDEDSAIKTFGIIGQSFVFSGGMKYLLLIMLEVLIFHFAVRTISILQGKEIVLGFKDFLHAEKRMIIVMIQNFMYSLIVLLALKIVFGILGMSWMVKILMFFVSSYFLGLAFFDNYNEQFKISIKESRRIIRKNYGAAIFLGVIAHVLIFVPLVGPLIAPLFCAVVATLYGFRHDLQLTSV